MTPVPCNLCGRDDWDLRFPATQSQTVRPDSGTFRCTSDGYGVHLRIVQCRHCGHVFANPRWSRDQLLHAYTTVEDTPYVAEERGRRRTFSNHLKALENITGPADQRRLLDIGAYTGVFVDVARKAGWQAYGLEPSRWAAGVAQSSGLPVIEGTLDAPEFEDQTFDVITMWDVIEHLDDPSAALARCNQLLRHSGVVAVHTMNIDSRLARIMGRRWPWLMNMHIHYFSPHTLGHMLELNGFEVLESGAQGRYLSLGYLTTRIGGVNRPVGRLLERLVGKAGLAEVMVPVNFGDLFTMYGRRPAR